jgi:hypothetical protein
MKKAMVAMMFLAGGLFAAPRISFGVNIGVPAPVAVVRPACPGPGYAWVDGYYANGAYVNGYWRPPVVRVAPRYDRAPVYNHRFDNRRVDNRHFDDHHDNHRR